MPWSECKFVLGFCTLQESCDLEWLGKFIGEYVQLILRCSPPLAQGCCNKRSQVHFYHRVLWAWHKRISTQLLHTNPIRQ